jgi:hypothetical protein
LLSIEGRAIRREHQGQGLGTLALHDILEATGAPMAASVTRNPAVPKLMTRAFHTVLPDLTAPDALHTMQRADVQEATELYASHVGADPADAPFVFGRYTGGLYGGTDPGAHMPLTEITSDPENGIIMIATDRRY